MKTEGLRELFINELRELYDGEKQIVSALPKMAKAANSKALKAAFKQHLKETQEQVDRLEEIFDSIGEPPSGRDSLAVEALVKQGQKAIAESGDGDARDAALITAAQKVEHYEIAGYGAVRTYAGLLGEREWARLLEETLDEEKAADKKLNAVSEAANRRARHGGAYESDKEEGGFPNAGPLIAGVALGVLGGLLFAPRAGEELRERVSDLADSAREQVGRITNRQYSNTGD
jgi:ferritin-like metal-binding protein YciE